MSRVGRYGDFWSKVQRGDASSCWPWLGASTRGGYGTAMHEGKTTTAHRVAFLKSGGVIADGEVVMHTCDNPPCCNPAHLRAATQQQNLHDMHAKGRAGDCRHFGEQHPRAKLTDEQVRKIRCLGVLKLSQQMIGDHFGVSQKHVSAILRNTSRIPQAA